MKSGDTSVFQLHQYRPDYGDDNRDRYGDDRRKRNPRAAEWTDHNSIILTAPRMSTAGGAEEY